MIHPSSIIDPAAIIADSVEIGPFCLIGPDVEIDEETLKTIANETGGKYFRATDNQKLKEVYREINEMEKAKIKTIEYDVDLPEKADIFILAAIALLFVEFIANKLIFKSVS